MVEHSGLDTAASSLQKPPRRLKVNKVRLELTKKQGSGFCMSTVSIRTVGTSPKLTNGLRDRHNLRAIKRQIDERPDDRVDFLHYVERDGDDAASILTHGYTPG